MEPTNQGSVEVNEPFFLVKKIAISEIFRILKLFKCTIKRESEYDTNEVCRTFEEFCELYQLLLKTFPALKLQETLPLNKFKEAKQTFKRHQLIESLISEIQNLQAEISHVTFEIIFLICINPFQFTYTIFI